MIKDHMGNEYNSTKVMCKHYGIDYVTFIKRMNAGWSLEGALTVPNTNLNPEEYREDFFDDSTIPVEDHNGVLYKSEREMCRAYKVPFSLYKTRLMCDWTLKDALECRDNVFMDHKGNVYDTLEVMCRAYGISVGMFNLKLNSGWSVQQILEEKAGCGIKDHKGNMYPSICSMCKAYEIPSSLFLNRINSGWELKEALEKKSITKVIKDHKGNAYASVSEMCEHYGIKVNTFYRRLNRGSSLEEALTDIVDRRVEDHKGNRYNTLEEMCKAYGIHASTYRERRSKGWSIKDALTLPSYEKREQDKIVDHKGNTYNTVEDMCKAYGLDLATYKTRKRYNWDLKRSLETPVRGDVVDHKGNRYHTIEEMCKAYEISYSTYKARKELNWSLRDILEKPTKYQVMKSKVIMDHKGNQYNSLREMSKAYGIDPTTLRRRLANGWNMKDALETHTQHNDKIEEKEVHGVRDHLGKTYATVVDMCKAYNIGVSTYYLRKKMGWSLKNILKTPRLNHYKKEEIKK